MGELCLIPLRERTRWHNGSMFLGDDLLKWMVLALGGALFAGNLVALLKPPPAPKDGDLDRAPMARSIFMGLLGFMAALWALASLVQS
jgi:hypothetical protein